MMFVAKQCVGGMELELFGSCVLVIKSAGSVPSKLDGGMISGTGSRCGSVFVFPQSGFRQDHMEWQEKVKMNEYAQPRSPSSLSESM